MFCKYCGEKIDDDSLFCQYCGRRIVSTNIIARNQSLINKENQVIEKSKSGEYLLEGNSAIGYRILNKQTLSPICNIIFEDVFCQGMECFDSILVKSEGKWGLINPINGKLICDFTFDKFNQTNEQFNNGYFTVYKNDFCGEIDGNGNLSLPIIYDEIADDGMVKYKGLWGVVRNNVQIIPCEYISLGGGVFSFGGECYSAGFPPSQHKSGKWGVIDIYTGKVVMEFEYDEIIHGDDYYQMRKGDKWGSWKMGEFRFPCEYTLEEIEKKRYFH